MMKNMKGRSPPPETWLVFVEKSILGVSMTDRNAVLSRLGIKAARNVGAGIGF